MNELIAKLTEIWVERQKGKGLLFGSSLTMNNSENEIKIRQNTRGQL